MNTKRIKEHLFHIQYIYVTFKIIKHTKTDVHRAAHRNAPEDGCINIRNMSSIKQRNNNASDIKLVSLYSTVNFGVYCFLMCLTI